MRRRKLIPLYWVDLDFRDDFESIFLKSYLFWRWDKNNSAPIHHRLELRTLRKGRNFRKFNYLLTEGRQWQINFTHNVIFVKRCIVDCATTWISSIYFHLEWRCLVRINFSINFHFLDDGLLWLCPRRARCVNNKVSFFFQNLDHDSLCGTSNLVSLYFLSVISKLQKFSDFRVLYLAHMFFQMSVTIITYAQKRYFCSTSFQIFPNQIHDLYDGYFTSDTSHEFKITLHDMILLVDSINFLLT